MNLSTSQRSSTTITMTTLHWIRAYTRWTRTVLINWRRLCLLLGTINSKILKILLNHSTTAKWLKLININNTLKDGRKSKIASKGNLKTWASIWQPKSRQLATSKIILFHLFYLAVTSSSITFQVWFRMFSTHLKVRMLRNTKHLFKQ